MELLIAYSEGDDYPDDVEMLCELCGFESFFFHRDFGGWTLSCWRCSYTYMVADSLTDPILLQANLPLSWEISSIFG